MGQSEDRKKHSLPSIFQKKESGGLNARLEKYVKAPIIPLSNQAPGKGRVFID